MHRGTPGPGRGRATAIGFVAVLLWSLLALFTVGSAPVPPFQLNAMCFAMGGMLGLAWIAATGRWDRLRDVRWPVYAFGVVGLFGYHALYFAALRMAPAAEAGLIAYLWPLLIVLASGLLPGERVRRGHIVGGILGLAGAGLVVARGAVFDVAALPGYAAALACALTWTGYSLASRRLRAVPTESVAIFCLGAAVLSLPLHMAFETTVPPGAVQWAAIAALGAGPVGAAFFAWDVGVKAGDIQLLGVASYAAPLLSTFALVAAGVAPASPVLLIAAAAIAGGAALAARASASGQREGT